MFGREKSFEKKNQKKIFGQKTPKMGKSVELLLAFNFTVLQLYHFSHFSVSKSVVFDL